MHRHAPSTAAAEVLLNGGVRVTGHSKAIGHAFHLFQFTGKPLKHVGGIAMATHVRTPGRRERCQRTSKHRKEVQTLTKTS